MNIVGLLVISCLVVYSPVYVFSVDFKLSHDFQIDYSHGRFLLDAEHFVFRAGVVHYFRIPRKAWRSSLVALRSVGLNSVYVPLEWATHESAPGEFHFSGEQDFEAFLRMVREERLWAIVKPGPFIGADRDLGGLPSWLLWQHHDILLRCNHPVYRQAAERYLQHVLTKLRPLLALNGGPVLMVEVEFNKDSHLQWLVKVFLEHLDPRVILFTGEARDEGERLTLLTAFFTPLDGDFIRDRRQLRTIPLKFPPNGPIFTNPTRLSLAGIWGNRLRYVELNEMKSLLQNYVENNSSFCLHMFRGGTNFGFSAGSIIMPRSHRFVPQITSYDIMAPISEDSSPNCYYYSIGEVLLGRILFPDPSRWSQACNLGAIKLRAATCLFDPSTTRALASRIMHSEHPLTFEELRQGAGFVLYETVVPDDTPEAVLDVPEVHDRAQVFVDCEPAGVVSRYTKVLRAKLTKLRKGQVLRILVENEGRSGSELELEKRYKGLTFKSPVTLGGKTLGNWTMHGFPLNNIIQMYHFLDDLPENFTATKCGPVIYVGDFFLPESLMVPCDTYLNMDLWTKGVVFVNGHNLGRYWPQAGPQLSLYLPGSFLHRAPISNHIVVFELHEAHPQVEVTCSDKPVFLEYPFNIAVPLFLSSVVLAFAVMLIVVFTKWLNAWIYRL